MGAHKYVANEADSQRVKRVIAESATIGEAYKRLGSPGKGLLRVIAFVSRVDSYDEYLEMCRETSAKVRKRGEELLQKALTVTNDEARYWELRRLLKTRCISLVQVRRFSKLYSWQELRLLRDSLDYEDFLQKRESLRTKGFVETQDKPEDEIKHEAQDKSEYEIEHDSQVRSIRKVFSNKGIELRVLAKADCEVIIKIKDLED